MLQRILLLPLLSPLLAVLLVAAINPKPAVSVRLLTWSSPTWPLGGWLAAASGLGAAMSVAGTTLALQGQAAATPARRQVRRRSESPGSQERGQRDLGDNWDEPPVATPRPSATWAGPPRSAGEPAPTVSVPFRVIRKGSAHARTPAAAAQPTASSEANDWNTPLSEDW